MINNYLKKVNEIKENEIINNSNILYIKNENYFNYETYKKFYIKNYEKLEKIFNYLNINIYEKNNKVIDYNLNYKENIINYILDYIYYYYENDYNNIVLNYDSFLIIKRNDLKKYKEIINNELRNKKLKRNKDLNFLYSNFQYNNYLILNNDYVILLNIYENVLFNNEYNLLNDYIDNKYYYKNIEINFLFE